MSSIPTTHLRAESPSGYSTFIVKSIGTCHCRKNFPSELFRQLSQLQQATTPSGSPGPDLFSDSNSGVRRLATHRHALHFSLATSPTRRRLRAHGPTSGDGSPPAALPTVDLPPYHLASPLWCRKMPFFFFL